MGKSNLVSLKTTITDFRLIFNFYWLVCVWYLTSKLKKFRIINWWYLNSPLNPLIIDCSAKFRQLTLKGILRSQKVFLLRIPLTQKNNNDLLCFWSFLLFLRSFFSSSTQYFVLLCSLFAFLLYTLCCGATLSIEHRKEYKIK